MAYINGKEVLPEELLREVQKYFKGGIIYIPESNERKAWGSNTSTIKYIKKRNLEIKMKKRKGFSINELMDEYNLSYDSIKKIVYKT